MTVRLISAGRGGGRGDYGPPSSVVEAGIFQHPCEGEAVCKLTNEKIPYFNAPIYLENITQVQVLHPGMHAPDCRQAGVQLRYLHQAGPKCAGHLLLQTLELALQPRITAPHPEACSWGEPFPLCTHALRGKPAGLGVVSVPYNVCMGRKPSDC